mgnify:CR=1 FL=1
MHARKAARDAYMWDGRVFTDHGDVHFTDPFDAARFTDAYNVQRPGSMSALEAAQTMAMALAHEVLHAVVGSYRTSGASDRFAALLGALRDRQGAPVSAAVRAFLAGFPTPAIYAGEEEPWQRLEREGSEAERWVTEELLLLWVTNQNPAYTPAKDIISDADLPPEYGAVIAGCRAYLDQDGPFGPGGESLVDLLLEPARRAPHDIFAQLEFMEREWGQLYGLKGLGLLDRLRAARVLYEQLLEWHAKGPGPGAPKLEAMRFGPSYASGPDIERYSPDTDWMPRVVLLAKSVYVWLDQLSKKYKRAITRLDQIPDEELELIARRGFSAIWFIGLFERSAASRRIKQMRGDHEALASAYSLQRYTIAHELGGEAAWKNVRDRAWRFGLRLAADMVPNHVGIDADWVVQHPDWFVQSSAPPFANYRFTGADLSSDPRVGIQLEDGYWSQTDAAVVFKRFDRWSGEERFIYHGNDGTSMPWNDTAQLDYTKPEVRKAVIDTILHVARMFPIIRFDAAMTLAKKHFQRLWFPLPGSGADIPSRANYAMSQSAFDAAMPEEFWREVVDTVAREAPDTLLLAEAFWLMEGFFVRTLGMHRVYNSAFMNMLKREENAKYRETIKNVLEYDPQILRRFVNFMSNPDEETAVDQFGTDDKYFGVCVLMCTMPGLPMFGHGQVEGLREKYGMEYARAKSDEQPNEWVIARHEREISPLMHRRHLFAGVDDFELFDFDTEHGVGEDVFAFVNGRGEARALVVYHNKFSEIRGIVRQSVPKVRADGSRSRVSLHEALGLPAASHALVAMRDVSGGLEYLRWADELSGRGLYCELRAFQYYVLTDFRVVHDSPTAPWAALSRELGNAGVPSLDAALTALHLRPVHEAARAVLMLGARGDAETRAAACTEAKLTPLVQALAAGVATVEQREGAPAREEDAFDVAAPLATFMASDDARALGEETTELPVRLATLLGLCTSILDAAARTPRDWALALALRAVLGEAEIPADAIEAEAELVLLLTDMPSDVEGALLFALDAKRGRALLGVNTHNGVDWLVKERWDELCALVAGRAASPERATELSMLAEKAGYRVADLQALLAPTADATDTLETAVAAATEATTRDDAAPAEPAAPANKSASAPPPSKRAASVPPPRSAPSKEPLKGGDS